MKKYSLLVLIAILYLSSNAQNRFSIANFPQFKHYLNPALTGYDGTSVQGFYRNQITTFDKAPQTYFLSGEVKLSDIKSSSEVGKVAHSIGLAAMQDAFGSTKHTGVNLSYAANTQITSKLNLRAGIALTYDNAKTHIEDINILDPNDPAYQALKNGNVLNKYGLNIGAALTSDNFYAGYAARDAVTSESGNIKYYSDMFILQHAVQAGYRYAFSENFGLVANGLYTYDANRKSIAEGHLKTVFMNTFWVGGGYRQNMGTILSGGVRIHQIKLGYSRELHSHKINGDRMGANEIVLSYNFTPIFEKAQKMLTIW